MHWPRDFGGRQCPRDVISHLHFPRPRTLSGCVSHLCPPAAWRQEEGGVCNIRSGHCPPHWPRDVQKPLGTVRQTQGHGQIPPAGREERGMQGSRPCPEGPHTPRVRLSQAESSSPSSWTLCLPPGGCPPHPTAESGHNTAVTSLRGVGGTRSRSPGAGSHPLDAITTSGLSTGPLRGQCGSPLAPEAHRRGGHPWVLAMLPASLAHSPDQLLTGR